MTRFLVVFDVDSTLINEEAIEVLADFANVRNEVAKITEQAMLGEIDFKESLIRRVRMLEGVPETKLFEVKQSLTLTNGAVELVSAIHSKGGIAAAVSGGFMQLLGGIQESLKLDFVQANTLEIHEGYLTGRVIEPVIDRAAKASYLLQLKKEFGLESSMTISVGDGANDIDMISAAGIGIAFCAKPALKEVADFVLDDRDLSKLIDLLP